jgi:S1-C subfamily serine protease
MDTAASSTFQFQSASDQAFAIPVNEVEAVARQIEEGQGSSTVHIGDTAMLGVMVGSQSSEGAQVENVLEGSPAANGGLATSDVITALDGTEIASANALTEEMLRHHPGDSVQVSWQTPEGASKSATITLESGPPA